MAQILTNQQDMEFALVISKIILPVGMLVSDTVNILNNSNYRKYITSSSMERF